MKVAAFVVLFIMVSGCADSSETKQVPSGSASTTQSSTAPVGTGPAIDIPDPSMAWRGNETVSSLDCLSTAFTVYGGNREWIQSILPSNASLPGNGPVSILMLAHVCKSYAIGNRTVIAPASTFVAHVLVERVSDGRTEANYPIEYSTSSDLLSSSLQSWGVYSENVSVEATSSSVAVQGTGSYEFALGSPFPQRVAPPALELLLWGDSTMALSYTMSRQADQLPGACMATFTGGRLSNAFPVPAPCIFTGMSGSETIQPHPIR